MRLNGLRLQHEYIATVRLYPHVVRSLGLFGSIFAAVLLLKKLRVKLIIK